MHLSSTLFLLLVLCNVQCATWVPVIWSSQQGSLSVRVRCQADLIGRIAVESHLAGAPLLLCTQPSISWGLGPLFYTAGLGPHLHCPVIYSSASGTSLTVEQQNCMVLSPDSALQLAKANALPLTLRGVLRGLAQPACSLAIPAGSQLQKAVGALPPLFFLGTLPSSAMQQDGIDFLLCLQMAEAVCTETSQSRITESKWGQSPSPSPQGRLGPPCSKRHL